MTAGSDRAVRSRHTALPAAAGCRAARCSFDLARRPILWTLGVVAAALALGGSPAVAFGETDFLPDNAAWNGMSELVAVARGLQLRLEPAQRITWDEIAADSSAVLLWIYPRKELPAAELLAFLNGGGRVLVADDFGGAASLLARLGIRRFAGRAIRATRHYEGNPHLPLATPGGVRHPLIRGIDEVVTNHPAYFRSPLPSLLGFDGGRQQLLVAGEVGKGRLVALSDPSVLINNMLRFSGNLRLATNLLRYLGRPGRDRLILLVGGAEVTGELSAVSGKQQGRDFSGQLNTLLDRINDFAMTAAGMRLLGFSCAVLAICGVALLLPWPRRDFDGHWVRPGAAAPPADPSDSTWAAAVLREEIEERLTRLLEAPGPISALHPRWVIDRVRQRFGDRASAVCEQLLSSLRQVPYTAPTGALLGRGRVSHRELAEIYEQGAELLHSLGIDDLRPIEPRPRGSSRKRLAAREERTR